MSLPSGTNLHPKLPLSSHPYATVSNWSARDRDGNEGESEAPRAQLSDEEFRSRFVHANHHRFRRTLDEHHASVLASLATVGRKAVPKSKEDGRAGDDAPESMGGKQRVTRLPPSTMSSSPTTTSSIFSTSTLGSASTNLTSHATLASRERKRARAEGGREGGREDADVPSEYDLEPSYILAFVTMLANRKVHVERAKVIVEGWLRWNKRLGRDASQGLADVILFVLGLNAGGRGRDGGEGGQRGGDNDHPRRPTTHEPVKEGKGREAQGARGPLPQGQPPNPYPQAPADQSVHHLYPPYHPHSTPSHARPVEAASGVLSSGQGQGFPPLLPSAPGASTSTAHQGGRDPASLAASHSKLPLPFPSASASVSGSAAMERGVTGLGSGQGDALNKQSRPGVEETLQSHQKSPSLSFLVAAAERELTKTAVSRMVSDSRSSSPSSATTFSTSPAFPKEEQGKEGGGMEERQRGRMEAERGGEKGEGALATLESGAPLSSLYAVPPLAEKESRTLAFAPRPPLPPSKTELHAALGFLPPEFRQFLVQDGLEGDAEGPKPVRRVKGKETNEVMASAAAVAAFIWEEGGGAVPLVVCNER